MRNFWQNQICINAAYMTKYNKKMPTSFQKIAGSLSESYLKVVTKLKEICQKVARKLLENC